LPRKDVEHLVAFRIAAFERLTGAADFFDDFESLDDLLGRFFRFLCLPDASG